MAGYQQQYIAAKATLAEAQKTYDADEDLYKAGMISEKGFTQDKNELAKAQATYDQMNKLFQIYNINEQSDYVIKAPVSGFIIERKINPRECNFRTDNTDNVFTAYRIYKLECMGACEYLWKRIYQNKIRLRDTQLPPLVTQGKVFLMAK